MTTREESQALYTVVGYITIVWSLLEQSLDHTTLLIYKSCNGISIDKRVPRQINEKLKFLRKAFSNLDVLSTFKDKGLQIIERTDALTEKRHELIHGAITNLTAKDGKYVFTKYDFDKEKVKSRKISFSVNDFQILSHDVEKLALDSARFSQQLQKAFLPSSK